VVDVGPAHRLTTLDAQGLAGDRVELREVPSQGEGHRVALEAHEPGTEHLAGLPDRLETVGQRVEVEQGLEDVERHGVAASGHGAPFRRSADEP
jgi:hypothetical protein